MICSQCGQTNDPSAKACASCGKPFEVKADGPAAQCNGCGATVHGPVGAMKCPYCGARVDIMSSTPSRSEPEEISDEERRAEEERARRHDRFEEDDAPAPSSDSNKGLVTGIVIAVIAVIVVGAVAGARSRSHKTPTKAERKSDAITATTKKTATVKPPSPSDLASVPIRSCRCAFGDGQSTPQVTLTLRAQPSADPTRPFSLGIERKSGFMTESSSSILSLPVGSALAPSADGGALPDRMGVACDTGIYVLVSDKTATGWSSVNAVWKWTTPLPASLVDGADAGAPSSPTGTDFTRWCTALPTQNGNATLSLAGGRHATLSLKDGKLLR